MLNPFRLNSLNSGSRKVNLDAFMKQDDKRYDSGKYYCGIRHFIDYDPELETDIQNLEIYEYISDTNEKYYVVETYGVETFCKNVEEMEGLVDTFLYRTDYGIYDAEMLGIYEK